jgi:iron complex transport system ATP-binding protein
MNPRALLAISDLHFSHPGHDVLQGVKIEILPGTITALLGPNGAGKTTLLHVVLGLLQPQAGQIWIAGRPLAEYSRAEMGRLVGLVPQTEHIPFAFTVHDYVLLGRAPYLHPLEVPRASDRVAAQAALTTVGAEHLADRPINALSGGEQQLAMLARVLVQRPQLLLLDEPTSHLDLGNRAHTLELLRALQNEGMTVVFSTHDPQAAASAADEVVLLRAGVVLATGPVSEVLTAERLTATYGVPVQVVELQGRKIIVT